MWLAPDLQHMGCCPSKPGDDVSLESAVWNTESDRSTLGASAAPHDILWGRRRSADNSRLSDVSAQAMRDIFLEYRRTRESTRNTGSMASDSERSSSRMSKRGLHAILCGTGKNVGAKHTVDEALFDYIWRLFDPHSHGWVDGDEFVVAMVMLTTKLESFEDQIDAVSGCARKRHA